MSLPYHSRLHATLDLARRIERAEIDFCTLAAGVSRQTATIQSGGGRGLCSGTRSPLNKVLGLGLTGEVTGQDLDRIEAFYRERQTPVQIELCPLAYADLATRLCRRGYVLQAFENELARSIGDTSDCQLVNIRTGPSERIHVAEATSEETDLWVRVTAEGFAADERPVGGGPTFETFSIEQMQPIMRQFVHPAIHRYIAWIDDEPAGGVATWIHKGVLGVFGASTRPAFRRRGVQTAVTIKALDEGCGSADLAIATTAPGSTSQRTFERLGFAVVYTRAIFVLISDS
jgi:hypothetical protein